MKIQCHRHAVMFPNAASVLPPNEACATKKTVVVVETFIRCSGIAAPEIVESVPLGDETMKKLPDTNAALAVDASPAI